MTAPALDPLLGALDAARRWFLRVGLAWEPTRAVLCSRDRRVAWQATVGALAAAAMTLAAPQWLFALGPILLGVPHVVSDLRHLLLRRRVARAWRLACGAFAVALVAVRAARPGGAALSSAPALELALCAAWTTLGVVLGAAEGGPGAAARCAVGLAVTAALAGAALTDPTTAQWVLLHAHNLVALALWTGMFRRAPRAAMVPLLAIVGLTACVTSTAATAWSLSHGATTFAGVHLLAVVDTLSPALPGDLAVRLTYAFVFLQSVHYAAWLAWIPQEDLRGEGTLSFRASARAVLRDLGGVGALGASLAAAALLGGALVAVHRARTVYLSLAGFHAYFELACAAYLFSRGGRVVR